MPDSQPSRSRADQVFVSAFVTNRLIPNAEEAVVQFTLEGLGYGDWETDGDAVEVASADLFVMVHWVGARRGAYTFQFEIRDQHGKALGPPFSTPTIEIPQPHYVYSWNLRLAGLVIPRGMNYL